MPFSFIRFAIIAFLTTATAAVADVEGSRDHPITGRFAGSEITGYDVRDFDVFKLAVGDEIAEIEGSVIQIAYEMPQDASIAAVSRSYDVRLADEGFEKIFGCSTSDEDAPCERDISYEITRLPLPRMLVDSFNFDYAVYRMDQTTVTILTSINNGRVYAQSSIVVEQELDVNMLDAEEIASELTTEGRVALYGILFDTDSADIKPQSGATLTELAAFLEANGGIEVLIVGHTDNQGALDYNMDLSQRRAASVRSYLVDTAGIAPGRLYSNGVGFLSPVAPNSTVEGRALNRRVEIVPR